MGGLLIEA